MGKYEIVRIDNLNWSMECIKFGNGSKSFVIIPGLSFKSVIISAGSVANMYKDFTDEYTVYVFDRRKEVPKDYSIRQMAEDTVYAMKYLGISKADIFGASQGGMIGQYIAIDYPELVNKMVLGSTLSRQNDTAQSTIGKWVELAEKKDCKAVNRNMFEMVYSKKFVEMYKIMFMALENDGSDEECERFEILARACLEMDSYNELDRIKCPVLVIGAENDRVVSCEASMEIADKIGCEIYIYKSSSHAVYDEAQDYKQRMKSFFEK